MPTITLKSFENATSGQQAFAASTVNKLEQMVNDPEFLQRLGTVEYRRNIYYTYPRSTNATNEDLIRVITGGIERDSPADNNIDLIVRLAKKRKGILGGVTPPNPTIETSIKYFEKWYSNNMWLTLAGHWFHEWLHTAGFLHARGKTDFHDAVYEVARLLVKVAKEKPDLRYGLVTDDLKSQTDEYFDVYKVPSDYR